MLSLARPHPRLTGSGGRRPGIGPPRFSGRRSSLARTGRSVPYRPTMSEIGVERPGAACRRGSCGCTTPRAAWRLEGSDARGRRQGRARRSTASDPEIGLPPGPARAGGTAPSSTPGRWSRSGSCPTSDRTARIGVAASVGLDVPFGGRWSASARLGRRGHTIIAVHERKIWSRSLEPRALWRREVSASRCTIGCERGRLTPPRRCRTARRTGCRGRARPRSRRRRRPAGSRRPQVEQNTASGSGRGPQVGADGCARRCRGRSGAKRADPGSNHGLDIAIGRLRLPAAPALGAQRLQRRAGVLALEKRVVLIGELAGLPVELDLLERRQRHALGRLLRIERLVHRRRARRRRASAAAAPATRRQSHQRRREDLQRHQSSTSPAPGAAAPAPRGSPAAAGGAAPRPPARRQRPRAAGR